MKLLQQRPQGPAFGIRPQNTQLASHFITTIASIDAFLTAASINMVHSSSFRSHFSFLFAFYLLLALTKSTPLRRKVIDQKPTFIGGKNYNGLARTPPPEFDGFFPYCGEFHACFKFATAIGYANVQNFASCTLKAHNVPGTKSFVFGHFYTTEDEQSPQCILFKEGIIDVAKEEDCPDEKKIIGYDFGSDQCNEEIFPFLPDKPLPKNINIAQIPKVGTSPRYPPDTRSGIVRAMAGTGVV
ncbi:MAG: hypothetical protein M1829_002555 [Trizodia sp. TS-e1964]|nr:MAG: hypothetical protein M1829_002555 [Trizodia sp. TS-e1964]